jgi:hypothetical protein
LVVRLVIPGPSTTWNELLNMHRLADHHRSISEKALIDALQYCGAIGGDSEREIRLFVEDQVKVGSKAEERTEVVIEYPEVDFDNLWIPRKRTDGR